MAKQTLAPFFVGTIDGLTFYKMNGKYFARKKSSLTAERVKTDACFAPTMRQADFLRRASRIGSAVYALVPKEHKQHSLYRILTGQANLYLKEGLPEEEILARLVYNFIASLEKKPVTEIKPKQKTPRKKSNKTCLPAYVRKCRRFKMIEELPVPALQGVLAAIIKEMVEKDQAVPRWLLPDLPDGISGLTS